MKVFVCLDDKNGMTFGGKRQSRDRIVIEDVLKTVGEEKLYIDAFSKTLFENKGAEIVKEFPKEGYFFNENKEMKHHMEFISEIIVYRWNRRYPADFYLDIDIAKEGFKLADYLEFKGSSHDKITKEIYRR
ncbi:MAG: ribonuclease Z [Oscillospiraceae bacterium]|nr:ribonuclease Z [Oscillospiraceae bacterium]